MRFRTFTALAACAVTVAAAASAPLPKAFFAYNIGGLDNFHSCYARGINAVGQIVGSCYVSPRFFHGFVTGPNGTGKRDVGSFGGPGSEATGINNRGEVVGNAEDSAGRWHAFVTNFQDASLRRLLPDEAGSTAAGINDAGQVVGSVEAGAYLTGPDGLGLHLLDAVNGLYERVTPRSVNAAGQVVGSARQLKPRETGFMTGPNGGALVDLGPTDTGYSVFKALNAHGQLCGMLRFTKRWPHSRKVDRAVASGPGGADLRILDTPGGDASECLGMNEAGTVVGRMEWHTYASSRAAIAAPGGAMVDLNTLVVNLPERVTLTRAVAINDSGQLVAEGRHGGVIADHISVYIVCPKENCAP